MSSSRPSSSHYGSNFNLLRTIQIPIPEDGWRKPPASTNTKLSTGMRNAIRKVVAVCSSSTRRGGRSEVTVIPPTRALKSRCVVRTPSGTGTWDASETGEDRGGNGVRPASAGFADWQEFWCWIEFRKLSPTLWQLDTFA